MGWNAHGLFDSFSLHIQRLASDGVVSCSTVLDKKLCRDFSRPEADKGCLICVLPAPL